MPRFIIERTVGQLSQEDLQRAGEQSIKALDQLSGVVWIKSYVCEEAGKIFCEYDAPSSDLLFEHARLAGLPIDRVSVISVDVSPAMFR